jgi:hypothetical protein
MHACHKKLFTDTIAASADEASSIGRNQSMALAILRDLLSSPNS